MPQTIKASQPLDLTLELIPRARFDVVELRSHFAAEHEAFAPYPHCLYWSSHTTAGFLDRSLAARSWVTSKNDRLIFVRDLARTS